jgi:excinuclease ABC subunit B
MDIIRDLRLKKFDVLVGINLLREGLDIPEVSLVAIMDADKEGFLRSPRSLIQTCGRAARNVNGMVIMYADKVTGAMRQAISETQRRRKIQKAYNRDHHIEPTTIQKAIAPIFDAEYAIADAALSSGGIAESVAEYGSTEKMEAVIPRLEKEMRKAAKALEFERAARLRDRIADLKKQMMFES